MTITAIILLVAWCFYWIIRDDLRTRRDAAWAARIESIVTDTSLYPGELSDEQLLARELADDEAVARWLR